MQSGPTLLVKPCDDQLQLVYDIMLDIVFDSLQVVANEGQVVLASYGPGETIIIGSDAPQNPPKDRSCPSLAYQAATKKLILRRPEVERAARLDLRERSQDLQATSAPSHLVLGEKKREKNATDCVTCDPCFLVLGSLNLQI